MIKNSDKLEIHKDSLTINGKPFYLASGDMHYFRYFKGGWKRRLQLMKDFGLTAIQTYVPWGMHEPHEGEFCFEGNLDLAEFLQLCNEIGLKVMFRPVPYMCSEWDFGGLPYWLQQKENIEIRTLNKEYMSCLRRYYERLAKEFVPYLSTNGGPIIAVAVENEYGSFGDDDEYIKAVGDMLTELGVDVPLFTANGIEASKIAEGSRPEYWTGIDAHDVNDETMQAIKEYQPDKPVYVAEFWAGRSQQWGGYFLRQTPEDVASLYKTALEAGAFVNFYMFCGGTTFGFHNGALVGRYGADTPDAKNRYLPFATSYDVDALVTEYGYPTPKYYRCKQVLKEYMISKGYDFTGTADMGGYICKTQKIENVKMAKAADFIDNAKNLAKEVRNSRLPLTFKDMDLDYGFMLYSTEIKYTDDAKRSITIDGLQDRAMIFVNGEYVGCIMRDRQQEPIIFEVPKEGAELDILVENMGRVNYGCAMINEYKGICGYVRIEIVCEDGSLYPWNYAQKTKWTNIALPCDDMSKTDFNISPKPNRPTVFEGSFKAEPGVDTFLNPIGWEKGFVEINGFNIGRYWSVGPQGTLYVPGELLKEDNVIRITELHNVPNDMTVKFDDKPSLDTIEKSCDLCVSVVG